MPVMDGLQATRLIRSFEENGYWDASVGHTCQSSPASSSLSQECYDETRKRKRTPIIAVTVLFILVIFNSTGRLIEFALGLNRNAIEKQC